MYNPLPPHTTKISPSWGTACGRRTRENFYFFPLPRQNVNYDPAVCLPSAAKSSVTDAFRVPPEPVNISPGFKNSIKNPVQRVNGERKMERGALNSHGRRTKTGDFPYPFVLTRRLHTLTLMHRRSRLR